MPDHFDQTVVLNQLRYSGMLETVKIRRTGFPIRRPFQDFCSRFVPQKDALLLQMLVILHIFIMNHRKSTAGSYLKLSK